MIVKPHVAFITGLMIPIMGYITAVPSTVHYSKPPEQPAEEEPSERPAPIELVATTTEELPEPQPVSLPEGVICLDDCPLIDPQAVESTVRAYFADIPIMIEIARCESRFRQYEPDGSPLRNQAGSSAIGVMQLMASYHKEPAAALGLDIERLSGNLVYSRELYNEKGTEPWEASKACWSKSVAFRTHSGQENS